jgi:8-oxo-dGTP pyrophosphatase MutT (NUDIX family)
MLAVTRRAAELRAHPREISLPGGRCDLNEPPEATALREAAEELGIDTRRVSILGRLDDAWSNTGNVVTPVVGWYDGVPAFRHAPAEVEEVIAIDLRELARGDAHTVKIVALGDLDYEDDILRSPNVTLYGLSADIVVDLLHWIAGSDRRRGAARLAGLRYFITNGRLR